MESEERLLILGASVLQLPAILEAKEMGYKVGVIDYDADAVGIPFADTFFEVSTNDIPGVIDVTKCFKPRGILTLATDMPVKSVAYAARECNLPAIDVETAEVVTDKYRMIRSFSDHGVEHPWYFLISDRSELQAIHKEVSFPCIIKPTDGSGSKGVALVTSFSELEFLYDYASSCSKGGKVIIEEYLEGDEVSVELMVINGEPIVLQVTDKITSGPPFFVEMGHTQPSRLNKNAIAGIKDLAIRAVRAVGINQGPAHVEIMQTDKGPKMIELGARLGGDCITTHLVPLSTGINMVRATIQAACGELPDIQRKYERGAAIRYLQSSTGRIERFENVQKAESLEGIVELKLTKEPGDNARIIKNSNDRIGFIIAEGKDADEAAERCEQARDLVKVVIE